MGDKIFSIGDFAKFARTTRATLYHYDKIGLLLPHSRKGNRYRFYSTGQLAAINLIKILRSFDMPLDKIKTMMAQRTPELMMKTLGSLEEKMKKKIADWNSTINLLQTLQKSVHLALKADKEIIEIKHQPQEAIILGDLNDYNQGQDDDYGVLRKFYQSFLHRQRLNLNLNYPVWASFSAERIKRGDWKFPDRFYFFNPEGADVRPAGLYAIGYTHGTYGQTGELYQRLIDHIDQNGFEICGDAYEEYPLNEVCVTEEKNYLIRVMITVRQKKDA